MIDMGTNTFNLLIAESQQSNKFETLHKEQFVVKIGQGGISKGLINEDAQKRLFKILDQIQKILQLYKVKEQNIWGVATSAFRNARNAREITQEIKRKYNISVDVISGEQEAEYIYYGVQAALDIGEQNVLLMDIGGGSVEFIICNQRKIHWKRSLEIGAQRLMDQYMRSDPISDLDIQRLEIYLESRFIELSSAVFNYSPKYLVGSSGAFETIAAIDLFTHEGEEAKQYIDNNDQLLLPDYELTVDDFHYVYQKIIRNNKVQRLDIPGMADFRVEMIVPATCLVKFVMERYDLDMLRISSYALKEGFLSLKLRN